MKRNQRFVAGRLRKRVLRAPVVDGWSADELGLAPTARAVVPLTRIDGELAVKAADQTDPLVLGEAAASALATEGCQLMFAWPERIVIVRASGQVLYADGDVVHFGPLALDRERTIERTGYEYLTGHDAEVRVELTVTEGTEERVEMLDPGAFIDVGPYRVAHERSFDPSDRPGGGARDHGYQFVVTRTTAPTPARPSSVPHPLDVDDAAELLSLARSAGFFNDDEATFGELAAYAALAERYEGPRQSLDEELEAIGPRAELTRLGESVRASSPGLWRGPGGAACYGRVSVTLDPARRISVAKNELGSMPGRLRKKR